MVTTLELPKSSRFLVIATAIALVLACIRVGLHADANWLSVVVAFFVSGYLADAFTGLAHFGFDYIFPDRMPILGPIAREFREHHEYPTLDPSNYAENLTKGAYCSLPLAILTLWLSEAQPSGWVWFTVLSTIFGMSVWGYFFHQIHSYAHMGSILSPEELHICIARIRLLPSNEEQVREFSELFAAVPIPPVIRFLQRRRLMLNPDKHNLHHVLFESDFSSVNGWSDPLLNLVLGPIARRKKAARTDLN